MPKRKEKEDSDLDFKLGKDENEESDGSNHAIKKEQEDEEQTEEYAKPAPAPVFRPRRQKKRRKKIYEISEKDKLPSQARKTVNGGYAHTNLSKSRISKSNAGNTPWNKGKNRSSADRAKIAAGVRARNRAVLLEKLKRLGMSEEEYLGKKREIKYLRERIRRAKRVNSQHAEQEAKKKLQAALDATDESKQKSSVKKEQRKKAPPQPSDSNFAVPAVLPRSGTQEGEQTEEQTEAGKNNGDRGKGFFGRDIVWTPAPFGDKGETYDQACPSGGPGGFICCDRCSKQYCSYLNSTVKDMEVQRAQKIGKEIEEIIGFVQEGRETLTRAYTVAKTKAPPLPLPLPPKETVIQQPQLGGLHATENSPYEWGLTTSTIDDGSIQKV